MQSIFFFVSLLQCISKLNNQEEYSCFNLFLLFLFQSHNLQDSHEREYINCDRYFQQVRTGVNMQILLTHFHTILSQSATYDNFYSDNIIITCTFPVMSSFFILFSDIPCGTKFLQELIFLIFAVFQKSTKKFLQKNCHKNFLWQNYVQKHHKQNLLPPFIFK